MITADSLEKKYYAWLKKQYNFSDLESGAIKIETPFLDSTYDYIVLYAEILKDDTVIITDDGWTMDNLLSSGLTFDGRSKSRNKILNNITSTFGIEFNDKSKELMIKTDLDHFANSKNRLLQAVMRVGDLSILTKPTIKSIFIEDIANLLKEQEVIFTPNINITLPGGLSAHFDFSIPPLPTADEHDEKLIKGISSPNNINRAKLFSYDANMARKYRKSNYIALIDDVNNTIKSLSTLKQIESDSAYPITFVPYSKAREHKKILENVS
ncbi:MAG: DUF1828 domain-containing protein [Liquorilactobacillus hordei]|uniref:DUF1828 domain-containing protein n=1 Tax=Liquorilactobacillus hordei TaxID=468911 RepID=UPI0039EB191B